MCHGWELITSSIFESTEAPPKVIDDEDDGDGVYVILSLQKKIQTHYVKCFISFYLSAANLSTLLIALSSGESISETLLH